jgi:hypothetical protein
MVEGTVVVDAVCREPVSEPKFPVNRENTGKIREFPQIIANSLQNAL